MDAQNDPRAGVQPVPIAAATVRQFFTRLAMSAGSRPSLEQWSRLPVETYFVAMRLPATAVNKSRRPCSETVEPLGALFASIRWE